ncbi:hypothetical protein LS70_008210 [Helicobacter sp. MIT 11-5569]|nr:hypothetical protein LS70_008210 [Helicobacter sp. MIT 11-5569]
MQSCMSLKDSIRKNMIFYDTLSQALEDGYRPCKVCMKEMQK